ncbi:MAG: FecR domain-containing protein [Elusimicrobiota bacterium]|nr:FecR domain-containing protein [Endomicrobiia bacterium]MDW8165753.1 FecR domain-containing protein [Elusimicrobiota bacterium]
MKVIIIFLILYNYNLTFSQQYKIQEAEEKEILLQEIEVKEGQTLSYIANYYFKDPKLWPEILKYNKLDIKDIYAPLPGMKLKVPIFIVKEKFRPAYLIYILNKVKYKKSDSVIWEEPTINMELYNNDAIATYEKSRANIKFYSGEILTIDENSFVTIRPELKQEEVSLHKGAVRATKAKIITDNAVITPRIEPKTEKTDFRTKIREEDKTTLVEVYEGAVDVTAQGKTVYVPKGFGTEVKPLSPPSLPKALPTPPQLYIEAAKVSPENELVLSKNIPAFSLTLSEPKIEKEVILEETTPPLLKEEKEKIPQPLKPKTIGRIIKKYNLQISKEKDFKKIIYEETNELKPDQKININLKSLQLPDGKYFLRVSYVDDLGFENPSEPKIIIIDTTPPKLSTNIQEITKTDQEILHISGETEPNVFLKINNNPVEVDKDGKFSYALLLNLGINKIEIIAKDTQENETKIQHQIERVKVLSKEEKKENVKQQTETEKGISLGTILATSISLLVIILVISFFIK